MITSVSTGYAVAAGHFSSPNVVDIAAGAPQHSGVGKVRVLIFARHLLRLNLVIEASVFLSFAGLHFQNRRFLFGEEFSSHGENGTS